MPLCICADEEEEVVKEVKQTPVKVEKKVPTSAAKPTNTMFMTSKRVTEKTYDLKGNLEEQIREAVKNTDVNGVKILLEAGANPKFVDATSNSLAHLAAMFDSLVIVEMLHAKGVRTMKFIFLLFCVDSFHMFLPVSLNSLSFLLSLSFPLCLFHVCTS